MADVNPKTIDLIRWAVTIGVPSISGLAGVLIGAWIASKQQKAERRLAFIEKQLKQFYSPIVGIRNEIQMLSELRVKISQSSKDSWQRLCEEAREVGTIETLSEKRGDEFKKTIDYNNRQLTESLLPSYRRMATIFREHYYLAQPQTRNYFRLLLEFVDLWERWLDKSIPHEVLEGLDHEEEKLFPFYENLKKTHDELRTKLVSGKG